MSKVNAELVKGVITTQAVDTLCAEDLQTGEKLYYATGAAAVLCEAVDTCEAMMTTPYRLRAWSSAIDRKRGNKPADQKPFVWTLPGRHGWGGVAPSAQPAPAVNAAAGPLDRDDVKEWAKAVAERDAMNAQLEAMRAELDAIKADLGEDEPDGEDEPVNAAPLSWWHTEAAGMMVKELAGGLSQFLRAKAAAPRVLNSAAPLPPTEGVSEREAELLRAFRTAQQTNPEDAAMFGDALLKMYGTPQSPAHESPQA
jgi:hypothetical protein